MANQQQMAPGLPDLVMVNDAGVLQQMVPGVMVDQGGSSPVVPTKGPAIIGGGFLGIVLLTVAVMKVLSS